MSEENSLSQRISRISKEPIKRNSVSERNSRGPIARNSVSERISRNSRGSIKRNSVSERISRISNEPIARNSVSERNSRGSIKRNSVMSVIKPDENMDMDEGAKKDALAAISYIGELKEMTPEQLEGEKPNIDKVTSSILTTPSFSATTKIVLIFSILSILYLEGGVIANNSLRLFVYQIYYVIGMLYELTSTYIIDLSSYDVQVSIDNLFKVVSDSDSLKYSMVGFNTIKEQSKLLFDMLPEISKHVTDISSELTEMYPSLQNVARYGRHAYKTFVNIINDETMSRLPSIRNAAFLNGIKDYSQGWRHWSHLRYTYKGFLYAFD